MNAAVGVTYVPRPWAVRFAENGGYDCMTDAYTVSDATGAVVVVVDLSTFGQEACVAPSREIREQAGAHARLIAAAPDLYEAARLVMKGFAAGVFVRNVANDDRADWAMRVLPHVDALARLEIAYKKAEGAV